MYDIHPGKQTDRQTDIHTCMYTYMHTYLYTRIHTSFIHTHASRMTINITHETVTAAHLLPLLPFLLPLLRRLLPLLPRLLPGTGDGLRYILIVQMRSIPRLSSLRRLLPLAFLRIIEANRVDRVIDQGSEGS